MKTYAAKTWLAKPGEVQERWWLVDAGGKVVGKLAAEIAMILMGKHRPTYTPHVDTGDYVVVINADKVVLTRRKWEKKEYTWYTGYHRLQSETAAEKHAKDPTAVLSDAVRRMLPKNKLATRMLDKMKIYAGSDHPHQAQNPTPKQLA